ncbi:MAG: pyruvate dehydrogenase (acetyl-transferring) E1 component subunit alpha [Streptosporangiales bacterium]|nr:pyruvate dehydrogenase (acetyl-transferring) E1 component subunit alpha [Streptosporangiales bacterium]
MSQEKVGGAPSVTRSSVINLEWGLAPHAVTSVTIAAGAHPPLRRPRKRRGADRPVRHPVTRPRPHEEWHVTVDASNGAASAHHESSDSAHEDVRAADRPTRVAEPPELVQLLTPEGDRVDHPDYPLDLAPDEVRSIYRDLVLVRRIDAEANSLQRQGELGIWASLLGQEAAQIGSGRALGAADMAFPTYREHGVAWCRGLPPRKLLELYRGVSHGGWDPAEHNFHLYTIVIGSQALHATGYAMGIQRDGVVGGPNAAAAIAYFGDGASSQGDVNEAFVFASVFNAPVVFFCQNNQWAISEPLERQSRIPLYRRANGFGFPGVRVDGNDVFACLAVTRRALQAARDGQGPSLIEAFTYRMGAHTTSDDPTRYRPDADLEVWKLKDPIERVKAYLARNDLADQEFFDAVEADADELGRQVRADCLDMPDPSPMAMFENVYVEPSALLEEEREQFRTYLASFEDEEAGR